MTVISKKYDFCHKKPQFRCSPAQSCTFFLNTMVINARREVYLFPSTANRGVAAFRLGKRSYKAL